MLPGNPIRVGRFSLFLVLSSISRLSGRCRGELFFPVKSENCFKDVKGHSEDDVSLKEHQI
jgi:hypothetical protein